MASVQEGHPGLNHKPQSQKPVLLLAKTAGTEELEALKSSLHRACGSLASDAREDTTSCLCLTAEYVSRRVQGWDEECESVLESFREQKHVRVL